jgi:hypothetical protein
VSLRQSGWTLSAIARQRLTKCGLIYVFMFLGRKKCRDSQTDPFLFPPSRKSDKDGCAYASPAAAANQGRRDAQRRAISRKSNKQGPELL